jgi:hypothetical protein
MQKNLGAIPGFNRESLHAGRKRGEEGKKRQERNMWAVSPFHFPGLVRLHVPMFTPLFTPFFRRKLEVTALRPG